MSRRWRGAAFIAALAWFGCGESKGTDGGADASCPPGPTVGDLPADVSAVLQAKCQPCHQSPPLNHAPWPLQTYEDTQQPYGIAGLRRWQRMQQVVQPGSLPQMPQPPAPQLDDAELATLNAWFAACAPPLREGTGFDVGEGDAGPRADAGQGGDGGGADGGAPDSGSADGGSADGGL